MMTSLLNKIGMAALLAASVTASELPSELSIDSQSYVDDMVFGTATLLQEMYDKGNQNEQIIQDLQAQILDLQAKQVTNDIYYANPEKIEMKPYEWTVLQTWTVKGGETMNFEAKLNTDKNSAKNHGVWLTLFKNNSMVAVSNDYGNGDQDNSIVSTFYRGKD